MSSESRPKAYSYVRMSTEKQSEGDSRRRQIDKSEAYAQRHNLDLIADFDLEDIGVSAFTGENVSEGSLGRFLQAAKSGKIEKGSVLLVESLDRISRQAIQNSLTLFLSIIDAGITIVTLTDERVYAPGNIEMVELLISLTVLSRAHEESKTKSQRVSAAWANKRTKAGSQPLTAMCPAWLRLSSDRTRYEQIDVRVKVVQSIFANCAAGIGNFRITQRLNKDQVPTFGRSNGWHNSYVAKILTNRSVLGEFQPHKVVNGKRVPDGDAVSGYFPSIVSEQIFYQAKAGRTERLNSGRGRKGRNFTNIFSGIAKCAYCKSSMKFENKGKPPKGGSFLICEGTTRGLSCDATRWRYDEFETSFLTFVSELNLEQLAQTTDEAQERHQLDGTISALTGQISAVTDEMEQAYQLMAHAGAGASFVGSRIHALAERQMGFEAELKSKRDQRAALAHKTSDFYADGSQLKSFIKTLQDNPDGGDLFRLRSEVAARIRSIISSLTIASVGDVPRTKKAMEFVRGQPGDNTDVLRVFEKTLASDSVHRRYFLIGFHDGKAQAVYPRDNDPSAYDSQIVSDQNGITVLIDDLPARTILNKMNFTF